MRGAMFDRWFQAVGSLARSDLNSILSNNAPGTHTFRETFCLYHKIGEGRGYSHKKLFLLAKP